MSINQAEYTNLVNQRNALVKENKRLKSALVIKGILWKDSCETNSEKEPVTDMVTCNG